MGSAKLKMVPRRAKKMSRHLSPFSAMASTFWMITSCLSYNSCALIGYCVNCVTVTFIVVTCVIEWTKRTHSEKQSRACTEVDLKWRMSVTSTLQITSDENCHFQSHLWSGNQHQQQQQRPGTVFPRIIARAIIFFFSSKGGDYSREGDYLREGNYFKHCSQEVAP